MKDNRPRNIDVGSISSYKFPITAISSILHRASGIYIFIMIPFLLCFLDRSLVSESSFMSLKDNLSSGFTSFWIFLLLFAATYHALAGIRHIIMDLGFGESMGTAKVTSVLVMVLGIIFAILWGIWLW